MTMILAELAEIVVLTLLLILVRHMILACDEACNNNTECDFGDIADPCDAYSGTYSL